MRLSVSYDLQTLRGDVFGGITAAVVGLPVALAFGVASGLGAIAGMYGAIAVGFFAAVFGGRSLRYPAQPVRWLWRWRSSSPPMQRI